MTIYSVVYTYVDIHGEYRYARAEVIGVFSDRNKAIEQAGRWIERENKTGMRLRRQSGTEWILWDETNKVGGYLTVETNVLDGSLE